ncbi:hypothetical protein GCM10029964_071840 [Kibdelosporangium lantanae]
MSLRMWLTGVVVAALAPAVAPSAEAASNVVVDGHARFEVLSPTLIRLEYAGDDVFQDRPTFNAIGRDMPVPAFTTSVSGGYREIRTAGVTVRYQQGSGPFTSANTTVQVGGVAGAPAFPSYCAFGTACQAENGLFGGDGSAAYDHQGYTGTGFLAGFTATGSSLVQDVSGVPAAGTYQLSVRYANAVGGDGQSVTRTLSSSVDGAAGPTFSLPPTGSWDTWAVASVTLPVGAGSHTVRIAQDPGTSGNVNLDSVALTATGAGFPAADQHLLATAYGAGPANALGGWDRALDNPEAVPTPEHPGILNRDGWYLLDDTRTALLNADHTITDRPTHGTQPYQDGYLFGYGQNYKQGLADLNALTGGAVLLPQSAYGVWYSRYFAYTTADYQNTLLPAFRSSFTPVDWLVVDTDWKSPSTWNGWNWNPALFPNPQAFLDWTKQQGLSTSLNIHPSIAGDDPRFATANQQAGGLPATGATSTAGTGPTPRTCGRTSVCTSRSSSRAYVSGGWTTARAVVARVPVTRMSRRTTSSTRRTPMMPPGGDCVGSRSLGSVAPSRGYPLELRAGTVVRTPQHHAVHWRHPGHVGHARVRGAVHP